MTISIIVAVYKVEACLSRCIDSLLAQTFTDFELLLIDDGSPDSSGMICDVYAEPGENISFMQTLMIGLSRPCWRFCIIRHKRKLRIW